MKKALFITLGTIFVGLGVLGAFLPIMPTTPFVLLAAACYARSSERLYNKLLNNRILGPYIRDWRENRIIPVRAKIVATVMIVASFAYSITVLEGRIWLQVLLFVIGAGVLTYIHMQPSTPRKPSEPKEEDKK